MRIAMIGTGYVGLVSGACLSEFGHSVVCVDKNTDKVAALRSGTIPIFEPRLDEVGRIAALVPGVVAALKRPDARDPHLLQFKRHPGARSFVWSSAVQHDFAIAGDFVASNGQFFRIEVHGAHHFLAFIVEFDRMPQVDNPRFPA